MIEISRDSGTIWTKIIEAIETQPDPDMILCVVREANDYRFMAANCDEQFFQVVIDQLITKNKQFSKLIEKG